MARIKFPYLKIIRRRNTTFDIGVSILFEPFNESRAYKRVDGQFIPIGWYVQWSDGKEEVILDIDLI